MRTEGRGILDITPLVAEPVAQSGVGVGLCHIFISHTSASLAITENADPRVHDDLESFLARLVPDGDPRYTHTSEGDDDMPAHIRTVVTDTALTVPISDAQLVLGTWQGIYLWEHRFRPQERRVVLTISGEDHR
ncbi:MAG: secondary thiamine-phosphate synthase enzyme YjbQ [Arenicellales bacterium]|nr:secondary thiamine-phosphate synthase enzyme YjbQ [Arenicellales bacterium]MDP6551243.1 secondary thiamine-phosphate synthase enzyme YjbQ [Arenicellales bacterium]MDP6918726.1 secondary thiamine-phosphate synthase enzyme YjbQ [Arenicellales bacterium]